MNNDTPYAVGGNRNSEQAEPTSANRGAGTLDMRVLIELQVISYLLHQQGGFAEDLHQIRQNVADSIT
jgi:hypothetical protein